MRGHEEQWRPVVGHEGRYEVSDLGRVRSLQSARGTPWHDGPMLMEPRKHTGGYLRVGLRRKDAFVHALVLEAFVGPRPPGMQAAHLDGTRTNNALANLRWATPTENQRHRVEHGTALRGERIGNARLTEFAVRQIRSGVFIGLSQRQIGALFGVSASAVSLAKSGKNWRHL